MVPASQTSTPRAIAVRASARSSYKCSNQQPCRQFPSCGTSGTALKVHLVGSRVAAAAPGKDPAAQSRGTHRRNPFLCKAGNTASSPAQETSSWDALRRQAESTEKGSELKHQAELREKGEGLPHTDAKLRLFGRDESEVRVTFYRDMAAWCPYCQKVWMMLEEKQIPYRIEKINMRSYGDKPDWFLAKVPSGLLPAMELDGQFVTESLVMMQMLEAAFPAPDYPPMLPDQGTPDYPKAMQLLRLERELFGAWCNLVFRPTMPSLLPFGKGKDRPLQVFESVMDQVEAAFTSTTSPWLLGGPGPSLVDLQYVSHVERMLASCLYWKGVKLRGGDRWPKLERWFDAFEQRPSYQASASDYYTHIRDIPPQYGDGYMADNAATKEASKQLAGGGWRLPLNLSHNDLEPLSPHYHGSDEDARVEAAWKLTGNHDAVVRFCCRGTGKRGRKTFQAPLADPYAEPNMEWEGVVDGLLRCVVTAMLNGVDAAEADLASQVSQLGGPASGEARDAAKCLIYLRDRVGVPRDMNYHAAMQLRAHLNWAIYELQG